MFFASLLALIVFGLLVLFFAVVFIGGLTSKEKISVRKNSVLTIDLSEQFREQKQEDIFSIITEESGKDVPGLYDLIRLIRKAAKDDRIRGIVIIADPNANGFATSEEIRNALMDFKRSGKFVFAHTDILTQKSYFIANVSDSVFVSPQGMVEWTGYNADIAFFKGTLDKLEVEPQIFYAGKFKSATEPFRSDRMSEENKLQTSVWLNDLYSQLLSTTSQARKTDTAVLRALAINASIRRPSDAVDHKLIDAVKYDDEVKSIIKSRLGLKPEEKIHFLTPGQYMSTGEFKSSSGGRIALIFAEGNIVDGDGSSGDISTEEYRALIHKARLDKNIKAIVLRINSGGGSAIASENIWRELALAKQAKPVIVSFGDVAASGGYYIGVASDSIFAMPSTITGSIGVFGIIPNLQDFFKNKLGVTFDGVKTGPYADALSITRPLNDSEKQIIQEEIENVYTLFKQRVAAGRNLDTAFVDSIAQGRVWTGTRAKDIRLIDRFGGIEDAINAAASKAGLKEFHVKEYPAHQSLFDRIIGRSKPDVLNEKLRSELGPENYRMFTELKKLKEMVNTVQARLPFTFNVR